ncbi:hypothetical protein F0562_003488 [Nyssa sinensis]|uniref:Pentatricopeptide repeat-containing protein n=1 Tax=Nyssa sinensis TaxID=561372 RepID=A0A5J5BVM8_9ASTE|nr:hypothetical protein F0562_003488 [Nyssa sinensis]
MLTHALQPDGVTFIGVLSACSRAGLVEKGCRYFELMVEEHGIMPIQDHYTCMIDLYSRAGRVHSNMEIGKWAAESLLELEPQNPATYILLSSMYATKGEWDKVAQLRRGNQPNDIEVQKLVNDAEKYTLANHLFWGLWGLISQLCKAFLIGMASTHGDGASSNSMAATSSSQNQGSTSTRRGRGRAKNNKLRLYSQLMGEKPTIVIPPDLTQPVEHNLHMFKAKLGIICRCYAPIAAATWKEMADFQNTTLRLRLEVAIS